LTKQDTTVDFIARGSSPDEWKMVLVESGPWTTPTDFHLRRIQERLYGCLDAAIDGKLAEKFPDSLGKNVVIQLDCYNVPRDEAEAFFKRFADGVLSVPDYKDGLARSRFVRKLSFEITFDSIH